MILMVGKLCGNFCLLVSFAQRIQFFDRP